MWGSLVSPMPDSFRNTGYAAELVGQTPGQTPISVNLRKNIARPLSARFCQLPCNLIPVPKGLGQTVGRQDCHTDLVIHECNFPPPAAPHGPIGIPRGKTYRPPPPCVRPKGWQRFCRAAMRARLPDLFSADVPSP